MSLRESRKKNVLLLLYRMVVKKCARADDIVDVDTKNVLTLFTLTKLKMSSGNRHGTPQPEKRPGKRPPTNGKAALRHRNCLSLQRARRHERVHLERIRSRVIAKQNARASRPGEALTRRRKSPDRTRLKTQNRRKDCSACRVKRVRCKPKWRRRTRRCGWQRLPAGG